jgi:hypothetical protein
MLRSAATPYPERDDRMKENTLEPLYRTSMVCGPKKVRTIPVAYVKL